MNNFLIKHALGKTWCSPRQDNQWVYAPTRVSKFPGDLGVTKLLNRVVDLPDNTRYYQVFRVGQLDPEFLNLIRQNPDWLVDKWIRFSDAMVAKNMEVTIYNEYGVNLLRSECYYRFTKDNCLFFIVPTIKKFPLDVETEQIYFRFYSNSSLQRMQRAGTRGISTKSYQPLSTAEILAVEQELTQVMAQPGKTRCYINGFLTNNFNLGNVQIGDYLEYVHDGSVRKVVRWRMQDLFNFRSDRDGVYKYMLHYAGDNNWLVDYQDDLDVYVVLERPNNFPRGLYYNRNARKNHRMLTHKDYAIDSNMAMLLRDHAANKLGLEAIPSETTYIEVSIRDSGDPRYLGFEANRIKELYKLPENYLYGALIGSSATMPEWYCVNLEKSSFVDMMDYDWSKYNLDLIEKGYGYNAIGKILGDSPFKMNVAGQTKNIIIPQACQKQGTAYEYDVNGLLLGWYPFIETSVYYSKNAATAMVEFIVGKGDFTTDTYFGSTNVPVDVKFDYRVYMCHIQNNVPDNIWEDITGSSLYTVENGKVKWAGSGNDHWLAVRTDKKFLAYDYEIEINSGTLNFSILDNPTGDQLDDPEVVTIPFAQLEIWLNKYKLIPGLDYFVLWPQVYITNALYLNQTSYGAKQRFHIRAHRLANKDLSMDKYGETGWVSHGMLSDNHVFNLRDDRVIQVNVGGRTFHPADLRFVEDKPPSQFVDPLNGFPYQLKPTIVPFGDYTNTSAYELRKSALEIDKRVSEYLTQVFGNLTPPGASTIGRRYPVVSPFLSHLLYLLTNKMIDIPADRQISDMELRDKVRPYEWLLKFDPMNGEHQPDIRYAFTIPHSAQNPYALEFVAFRFFKRVTELYGYPGLVVNEYVTIRKY